MKTQQILSTLLLVAGLARGDQVTAYKIYRNASEIGFHLESPQITDFGTWGEPAYCPPGEVVTGFQLKVEPKNSIDDTALNGIRFYCGKPGPAGSDENRVNITSKVGHFGNWGRVFNCSTYAVGFELQSQEYQGPRGDDTAANNMKLLCAGGGEIEGFHDNGHSFKNTRYTGPQTCPTGKAICALQTQVERYQIFGDDTALNNLRVKCCNVLTTPEIPPIAGFPVIGGSATSAAPSPAAPILEPAAPAPEQADTAAPAEQPAPAAPAPEQPEPAAPAPEQPEPAAPAAETAEDF